MFYLIVAIIGLGALTVFFYMASLIAITADRANLWRHRANRTGILAIILCVIGWLAG